MVAAVIVGAGEGKRMGASGRKQFVKIAGKPIIAYTIEVFEHSPLVDHIVIVVPLDSVDMVKEDVVAAYGMKKVHAVVYGGATRQESVMNGLKAVKQGTQRVVVHDAVRPLVSDTLIRRVMDAAQKTGAAITAVPARDTVKRVESGEIVGTIDRRLLWLAQTPQCFGYDLLIKAHTKAVADKVEGTDDASLVERIGAKVVVAVGSYSNIKMTTPEDLPMFEYFLSQDVRARLDSAVERGHGVHAAAGGGGGGGKGRRGRHRRRRPRRRQQKGEGAHPRGGEGRGEGRGGEGRGGEGRGGEGRGGRQQEHKGGHHRDGVRHS